jgi:two-component system, chemotaxis family, chemotaxis protein CheY
MRRSLVVDDARVVRKVARKIFEDLGFVVEEAADGQEAVSRVQEHLPDVMLLDWNMPVMNGIECLVAVRRLALPVQPKIIMCTTENEMERIIRALELGADEYIMKPFDSDILRAKLEQTGVL